MAGSLEMPQKQGFTGMDLPKANGRRHPGPTATEPLPADPSGRGVFTPIGLSATGMRKRRAFTLVELLVVIGIIGVLISILLPVVNKARQSGARVACAAQLADIGRMFQMYLETNRQFVPYINNIPSEIVPTLLPVRPGMVQVLNNVDDVKEAEIYRVFRCPMDVITHVGPNVPGGFDTYYDRDGTSYLYDLNTRGGLPDGSRRRWQQLFNGQNTTASTLIVMAEKESFHGRATTRGAMNYLFGDGHVGDIE